MQPRRWTGEEKNQTNKQLSTVAKWTRVWQLLFFFWTVVFKFFLFFFFFSLLLLFAFLFGHYSFYLCYPFVVHDSVYIFIWQMKWHCLYRELPCANTFVGDTSNTRLFGDWDATKKGCNQIYWFPLQTDGMCGENWIVAVMRCLNEYYRKLSKTSTNLLTETLVHHIQTA